MADAGQEFDRAAEAMGRAAAEIRRVVFGQDDAVERMLACVAAGGHALLVGPPGVAKTLLARSAAAVLGLEGGRVQCTPDLMPADVLGSEVLEEDAAGRKSFRFIDGPVFCGLLLADEINRAGPRTQSALLQAMQEGRVTVGGRTRNLPSPFHVIATQNPLEHEGTYPLPEAQLDRFLMQIDVEYPDMASELRMVAATTGEEEPCARSVLGPGDLAAIQSVVRRMPLGRAFLEEAVALVRQARPGTTSSAKVREGVRWGPGPRAAQAFSTACRARALLRGRPAPEAEDLDALAGPILAHRIALTFHAKAEGAAVLDMIQEARAAAAA